MASSAPPAGPANSGGGEQSSDHLPSSSDSPVSPVRSETPPSSRQRFVMKRQVININNVNNNFSIGFLASVLLSDAVTVQKDLSLQG